MTFHTPVYLWGLLSILIPIIIYFTGNIPQNEKVKRLILLITRVLMITAVVIIFARPVIQGKINNIPLGEIESKLVIIIDNSASMAMTTATTESLLDNAKRQAQDVINALEGPTAVDIYQTCPFMKIYSGDGDLEAIAGKLNRINQSMLNDELWNAVNSACQQVSAYYLNYECIIISDFPGENLQGTSTYEDFLSDKIKWQYYFLTQSQSLNNVSIKSVNFNNEQYFIGSPLNISSVLANESNLDNKQVTGQLINNNIIISQTSHNFNSHEEKNLLFQFTPEKRGLHKWDISISNDDYSLDNKLPFELVIPSEIRCLVVNNNNDDALIINTALESITKYADEIRVVDSIIDENQIFLLDNIDVLILNNISEFSRSTTNTLKQFLYNGGGVIWFPGKELEGSTIDVLSEQIQFPLIMRIDEPIVFNTKKTSVADVDHVLFSDLNTANLIDEMPNVKTNYKTNNESLYHSIINISQDKPYLLELHEGSGSILLFTSPLDMNWNDLAISGFFTPLLYRMIVYLKQVESQTNPISVGGEKYIPLNHRDLDKHWSLETPSGEKHIIIADFSEEALIISETSELGRYHIFANGKEFTSFSTRLHHSEYPSNRVDINVLKRKLSNGSIHQIDHNESVINKLRAIRYGRPLWRQFLIAFLILLVIETFITRFEKPTRIQDN